MRTKNGKIVGQRGKTAKRPPFEVTRDSVTVPWQVLPTLRPMALPWSVPEIGYLGLIGLLSMAFPKIQIWKRRSAILKVKPGAFENCWWKLAISCLLIRFGFRGASAYPFWGNCEIKSDGSILVRANDMTLIRSKFPIKYEKISDSGGR